PRDPADHLQSGLVHLLAPLGRRLPRGEGRILAALRRAEGEIAPLRHGRPDLEADLAGVKGPRCFQILDIDFEVRHLQFRHEFAAAPMTLAADKGVETHGNVTTQSSGRLSSRRREKEGARMCRSFENSRKWTSHTISGRAQKPTWASISGTSGKGHSSCRSLTS